MATKRDEIGSQHIIIIPLFIFYVSSRLIAQLITGSSPAHLPFIHNKPAHSIFTKENPVSMNISLSFFIIFLIPDWTFANEAAADLLAENRDRARSISIEDISVEVRSRSRERKDRKRWQSREDRDSSSDSDDDDDDDDHWRNRKCRDEEDDEADRDVRKDDRRVKREDSDPFNNLNVSTFEPLIENLTSNLSRIDGTPLWRNDEFSSKHHRRREHRCRWESGDWSAWRWVGECSDDCGGYGWRTRRRKCLSERHRHECPCRGRDCERKRCNLQPCTFPRLSCAPGLRITVSREGRRPICTPERNSRDTPFRQFGRLQEFRDNVNQQQEELLKPEGIRN